MNPKELSGADAQITKFLSLSLEWCGSRLFSLGQYLPVLLYAYERVIYLIGIGSILIWRDEVIMITALKQRAIVGKGGQVGIISSGLREGTTVEIIVLVEPYEQDATEELLSSYSNRKHLTEAIKNVENRKNLVVITPEEWDEKYSV